MTITTRSRRQSRAVFALLAAALLAAACSDDPDTSQPPPGTEAPEPAFVTVEPADTTSATEPAVVESTVPDATSATEPAVVETTVPDATEAPEPTADTVPADTTEADSEEPVTDDPDGDGPAGADEPDTTEAQPDDADDEVGAQPEDETSAYSVFPARAYFDHAAIRALFPNCPPPPGGSLAGWIDDLFDHWGGVYAGWDTDSERLSGLQIASGWWTDEQLADWYPGGGITATSARRDGTYDRELDTVKLWPVGPAPAKGPVAHAHYPYRWPDGTYTFRDLYLRAESRGYSADGAPAGQGVTLTHIRDDGMPGNAPNPPDVDVANLLIEWMLYRYTQPPTTGEPAAYAMRTLLEAHNPNCVAAQMRSICDFDGKINEPLLHREDRFGRVLWSLVCPQA
ncbi:hypothetical protein [Candidatus Poriferisodalis sp.]|uniref:hypothetical protein n=1 Tax=Candidatus Poriferisodalis sp. TaxID=3101277 RepID=UPI003B529F8E